MEMSVTVTKDAVFRRLSGPPIPLLGYRDRVWSNDVPAGLVGKAARDVLTCIVLYCNGTSLIP